MSTAETCDTASASTSQIESTSAGSSAKGKGGKDGRGGARREATPTVQLSKALSYILRHGAAKEGLKIRPDGYILLSAVLARPKISKLKLENGKSPTQDDILQVVASNDKKRFEVSRDEDDSLLIRAVQGHSISEITSLDHRPLTLSNLSILSSDTSEQANEQSSLPEGVEILHGTNVQAWEMIRGSGGLSKMKRNHIHLAKGRPGSDSVISGMRNSSSVIIHIDLIAALQDGIPFFLASNGAVLTSGKADTGSLPLQFITKVEDTKTGASIWPLQS
ncbi:hypothetical protein CBS101457_001055 [Exobasidium rhododendri]|nr:hypothetical protein CBS101457_001055 [Exobasidium rhododendri]